MKPPRRRRSKLFPIGLVLILVGLLLGPGYGIIGMRTTGRSAGSHRLELGQPVAVELEPAMNPIHLSVDFRYGAGVDDSPRSARYTAKLSHEGASLWTHAFLHPRPGGDVDPARYSFGRTSSVMLGSVDVERDGSFEFLLEIDAHPRGRLESIDLVLRRNGWRQRPSLITAGIGLVSVGLLLALIAFVRSVFC